MPTSVSGSHDFESLAAGRNHTCGLLADGQALCWGINAQGQLGISGIESRVIPEAVSTTLRFDAIVAGEAHTCALTAAGEAYCWGWNDRGQLGTGIVEQSRTPPTAVSGGHTFVSLTAGRSHTCGIRDDGEALCWGWNSEGQLGDGGRPTSVATPTLVVLQ